MVVDKEVVCSWSRDNRNARLLDENVQVPAEFRS